MSKTKIKDKKPKARLPRGFVDRTAADIRATDAMLAKIRVVYEQYGFDPIETPLFEYTDCLGKFLPDTDRPNAGVFSVQDDDEQWMSLRYDMTAPLARHVAENIHDIQLPFRSYRSGYVFRNEKPGPGRFRQFMQFDADSIGAPGVPADAEMCMMMADTLEALGIKRGDYVIRVNNRKVLDGVMDENAITDQNQRLNVLRAIDKLDKFGKEGIAKLLGEGRMDESGDFTKGAGLNDEQSSAILLYLDSSLEALGEKAVELIELQALCARAGYQDRVRIDTTVVRGLEYYTGMVYEAELLFDVTNEKGETVQFGSVGGGGRYDGLIKRFTGRDVPATGFSIGVSRLMTALKNLEKLETASTIAPVLVTVMDGDLESLGSYQAMVHALRQAGIRAEMYQGNWKKFGNQLKYADRRGVPIAVIQGSEERATGKIQLKDLIEGRRQAASIESNEEWREKRPGQFEIAANDLVDEVQKLLAEQAKG